ncbi:MAG TPA: methyl-accepting chemotaxis protein [Chloroflexota bacterium]|nr:methyl-accepting chemotaxis protein [Chloroflexota bacterium]
MNGQQGIRTRLLTSFAVLLALLLLVGLIGWKNTTDLTSEFHALYADGLEPSLQLADIEQALGQLRMGSLLYGIDDATERAQVRADEARWLKQIDDNTRTYAATNLTPDEQAGLQRWNELYPQYVAARNRYMALQDAGQSAEADAERAGTAANLFTQASQAIDELQDLQRQKGIAMNNAVAARASISLPLLGGALALALLLGLAVAWWVTRSITAGLAARIRENVAALSTSTAEIVAAVAQQSAGATEQSAAIAQTTATVDEVKASTEQAVRMAETVADSAQQANRVAGEGVAAVAHATAGLSAIREQVQSIADNILALSEQSQQIGEIIATVNDLADQSNLLALNAAIEAARAGEHGKGFGVVAGEIRTLAEQSKGATAQVRTILSDIQRATNAAVMATEQGTKGVDAGVHLIEQAGHTIEDLSGIIEQTAQVAQQIAGAVRQHAAGMEQIAAAMLNINQATGQSLAATRDTQQATEHLNDVAGRLKLIVAQSQA